MCTYNTGHWSDYGLWIITVGYTLNFIKVDIWLVFLYGVLHFVLVTLANYNILLV